MNTKKHIVIYSHGFGVRKDDNGLLSDIAENLPELESVLFDYYDLDEVNNELLICPPSQHVNKLNKTIQELRIKNPEAIIDLIAHSQGTIVAAMANPDGIRKAVLLAPVFDMGLEGTLSRYRAKPGAELNINGTSRIPSSNGFIRVIPKEYWQERLAIKTFQEYNSFSEKTEIIAIEAKQDELLPKMDLKELSKKIKIISLDGDHGFHAPNREGLIKTIRELLL
jgi:pimeloyl-ACP methyl ester carboxylesterase